MQGSGVEGVRAAFSPLALFGLAADLRGRRMHRDLVRLSSQATYHCAWLCAGVDGALNAETSRPPPPVEEGRTYRF